MFASALILAALLGPALHRTVSQSTHRTALPLKVRLYFIEFTELTYAPVTAQNIKSDSELITVTNKQEIALMYRLLEPTHRKGRVSQGFIRLLVAPEGKGDTVLVDANGCVSRSGRQFEMTPSGFLRLDHLLSRLKQERAQATPHG